MSRERLLLKLWMLEHGFGDSATGIISSEDYERFAQLLPSKPRGESIRQVVCGYRPAGWDLAFEIEAATGISAHDVRGTAQAAS